MNKYVIFALVLLAAYGIAMAAMWTRYEPRDVHVEFPSAFREDLQRIIPGDINFMPLTPITSAVSKDLPSAEASDAVAFLALIKLMFTEIPVIETTVRTIEGSTSYNWRIQVQYSNVTDAALFLTHTEYYDWPGRAGNWTATNLSYDGGDFHFDNKGRLLLLTWIPFIMGFVIWALLVIDSRDFRIFSPKRPK